MVFLWEGSKGKGNASLMSEGKERRHKSPNDNQDFDSKPLPDKIGTSLRQLYDEVLNEDVPDDFLNLLRKADSKSAGPAGSSGERESAPK